MATSSIEIANIALRKIGAKKISAFDEASSEAEAVNDLYNDTLDEILESHLWNFAQQRFILTKLSTGPLWTEDRMMFAYSKPADLIKVNFTNFPNAIVKIEGNQILSDTDGLKIIYTFRNTDPTTYSPGFTQAFATLLAHYLCFNLTESAKKAEALLKDYEDIKLPRALAMDSQQGTPLQPIQDEWDGARILGSGVLYGQAGMQTWHPIW